jgi:tRNA pseudouridine55 synthase
MSLHGVALVDKPEGLSSFAVVARIRRIFRPLGVTKAGHTGTLDPLASGLLPVCVGEATRYAQRLLDAPKGYRARIQFGTSTTTLDREGEVVAHGPKVIAEDVIAAALPRFIGRIQQVPPVFSALKIDGRPAYELARKGEAVRLAPREVEIHRLALIAVDATAGTCDLEIECSKGTYIRTLAADLASAVGTVGHLALLRRTLTGGFRLDDARPLDQWLAASEAERVSWLRPTDTLVTDLPRLVLDAEAARALCNGKAVALEPGWPDGLCRVYDCRDAFLGLGDVLAGRLRAERLLPTGAA